MIYRDQGLRSNSARRSDHRVSAATTSDSSDDGDDRARHDAAPVGRHRDVQADGDHDHLRSRVRDSAYAAGRAGALLRVFPGELSVARRQVRLRERRQSTRERQAGPAKSYSTISTM